MATVTIAKSPIPITKTPPASPSLTTILAASVSPETERLSRESRAALDAGQEILEPIYKAWRRAEKLHREGDTAGALKSIALLDRPHHAAARE